MILSSEELFRLTNGQVSNQVEVEFIDPAKENTRQNLLLAEIQDRIRAENLAKVANFVPSLPIGGKSAAELKRETDFMAKRAAEKVQLEGLRAGDVQTIKDYTGGFSVIFDK